MLGLIAQVFWALYTVFSASLIIFINLIPINVIDELIINGFFSRKMSAPGEPTKALMSVVSSWPVEKYARFVQPSVNPGPLPLTGEESGKAPNSGSWQVPAWGN